MVTQENFKNEVLEYRLKNKMTQEKFAERTGISRVTIIGIESGKIKKLNSMTLFKLQKHINNI